MLKSSTYSWAFFYEIMVYNWSVTFCKFPQAPFKKRQPSLLALSR